MITAELNQSRLPPGARLPRALISRVLREVARGMRRTRPARLSVAFVSPQDIRRLNRAYRKKDKVTDVLSFPLADGACDGEVLICYARAKAQARDHGYTTREEIVTLLVHGALHVFGYDHETPRDAKRMFPLQSRILKRLGIAWV